MCMCGKTIRRDDARRSHARASSSRKEKRKKTQNRRQIKTGRQASLLSMMSSSFLRCRFFVLGRSWLLLFLLLFLYFFCFYSHVTPHTHTDFDNHPSFPDKRQDSCHVSLALFFLLLCFVSLLPPSSRRLYFSPCCSCRNSLISLSLFRRLTYYQHTTHHTYSPSLPPSLPPSLHLYLTHFQILP